MNTMSSDITITRRLEIDTGHRVLGHEGKCAHPHGHRYVFEFEARAKYLDSLGRVIDFSVIKKILGTWLDENWDHGMVLCRGDQAIVDFCVANHFKHYIMAENPTAENMAQYLLEEICPDLFAEHDITISKVTIWETPNCRAEATFD